MKDPKINTEVKHSQSKDAWNVVGTTLTKKYKIAREKDEAMGHAEFISFCFNNSIEILNNK